VTGFPRRISEVPPRVWILLCLVALTFGIYGQTAWHPFIDLDDEALISGNPHVLSGLRWENILWAFTSTSGASFWHPLTWLSFMTDVELFGPSPAGHHLMSAAFHGINSILLFLLLQRMTGSVWRSGFVAALFAVHPLHVESVAWISERKDVLSTLFFLLSLWTYARYTERPGLYRYLWVVLFFGMALMSKPMVMTLPFVLLLIDFWPLARIERESWKRVVCEKVPLLLMSMGSIAVTLSFGSGRKTPWLASLEEIPLWARGANAAVSYVTYLWKTVWPVSLAVIYPHPGKEIVLWKTAIASLILVVATFLIIHFRRRRPYLATGWLFYLGTMFPAIGLVQSGYQSHADRFTYIPLIGIFVAIAWWLPDASALRRLRGTTVSFLGCGVILVLSIAAWNQTRYWRDSITLFSRAVAVTENNRMAMNLLGQAYVKSGKYSDAIPYLQEALKSPSDYLEARTYMGIAFRELDRPQEAVACFRETLSIDSGHAFASFNLGLTYDRLGQPEQAIASYREAVRIDRNNQIAWNNMGVAFDKLGRFMDAISAYQEALRTDPSSPAIWTNLGVSYGLSGNNRQAIENFQRALQIDPNYAEARNNLAVAIGKTGGGN
jgi:Flp pilus assembly protein TadD